MWPGNTADAINSLASRKTDAATLQVTRDYGCGRSQGGEQGDLESFREKGSAGGLYCRGPNVTTKRKLVLRSLEGPSVLRVLRFTAHRSHARAPVIAFRPEM